MVNVIHCSVHICRKTFRPAYGKLDILGSIFANVPFLALTATANSETKSMIIESLQLTDVELIEVNPDRENIFYDVKNRPSHGDDKLDPILKPVANMLKELKLQMELTIIYGTLQTCADCFLYFSKALKDRSLFQRTGFLHSIMLNAQIMKRIGLLKNLFKVFVLQEFFLLQLPSGWE